MTSVVPIKTLITMGFNPGGTRRSGGSRGLQPPESGVLIWRAFTHGPLLLFYEYIISTEGGRSFNPRIKPLTPNP
jgi:hypothetical protein